MSEEISKIILEELRAFREDAMPRLTAVERWQSNVDGKISMFGLICVALGGLATWLTGIIHK